MPTVIAENTSPEYMLVIVSILPHEAKAELFAFC